MLNKISNLFYRGFRSKVFRALYKIFTFLALKPNQILFVSDSHSKLDGNFAFIYKEIRKQQLPVECKFILKDSIHTRKSVTEIIQLAYYLATSRYIILDDFYPMVYPLKIRKGVDLIQVWHAVGAFKKFGYSRSGYTDHASSLNHKNYTKVIVSTKNVIPMYAEGFGVSKEKIYPIGIPRTDVFFDQEYIARRKEQLYESYPALKGKKVILFAPTFRGTGQASAHYPFEKLDLSLLYRFLKEEHVFLFKMHPFVKETVKIPPEYCDFFYDLSDFREINELLFIADILITDYSSVCFEFALLNKPMVFFAFDLQEYTNERDFYFPYDSFIPGKRVETTEEMIEKIINQDFSIEKIDEFVQYNFDHLDGKSSERFVNTIIRKRD